MSQASAAHEEHAGHEDRADVRPARAARPRRLLVAVWQYYPVTAGGAEHQARLQAEELVRRGYRVTVLAPRTRGTRSGAVNGVFARRLPIIDRRPFRTASYLAALTVFLVARLAAYDLVHVHLANLYSDLIVLLARVWRRPVYVKIAAGGQSGEVRRLRQLARVTRYVGIRGAARVQALSEEIADELRAIGVPDERMERIPNGVDVHQFAPAADRERAEARRALNLPAEGALFVYLGRFAAYKGVLELTEAWRRLPPHAAAEAALVLVGYRPDRTDEQLEVPRLHGVHIRNWTDRSVDYLRAADAFVLPSRSEGMSNVLLEAMACGLAVVATRVGAAESVVSDGVSGLLVPAGDVEALAGALERLATEPALRERLGRAACEAIAARYSVGAVVDRIEAVYDELLAARPATPAPPRQ